VPYHSKDEFQNLVQKLFARPTQLIFGNETADAALGRFRQAVDFVLSSYREKNVVVVAHGTVISLYVAWLTGCDGYDLWQELGLPSFVVLDIQSKTLIETVNLT
jgi:broad specificity phosphatase PhoE